MGIVDVVVNQNFYVPKNSIDKYGYDMEDYRSMLSIKYLEIEHKYLPFGKAFIDDCFFVAAKNFKVDVYRKTIHYSDLKEDYFSIDKYLEARDAVALLQNKLSQTEFYILLKYVFKHYNDLENNSGFYNKAHKVIRKAKLLLKRS